MNARTAARKIDTALEAFQMTLFTIHRPLPARDHADALVVAADWHRKAVKR
jgi:hypothetical protein